MYILYWSEGTASFGPQAVLEEASLDHEIVVIDTGTGAHQTPEYMAIHPLGKVPALALPDGQVLYEAAAIMLYLADHHGLSELAPAIDDPARGLFYRSLFYLSNNVQETYKRFYYPERFSTDHAAAPGIKVRATENLVATWQPVEGHLATNGPFHLGSRFSLVDIYLVMLATWFDPQGYLFEICPAVQHCYDLVAERPAIRRCLDQQSYLTIGKTAH